MIVEGLHLGCGKSLGRFRLWKDANDLFFINCESAILPNSILGNDGNYPSAID